MQLKRSGYGVACSVATALFWRRSKRDNEMSHWRRTGASIAEEGLWVLRLVCDASTRSRIAWTVAVEQERFELIAIRCFECSGILDDNELFSGHYGISPGWPKRGYSGCGRRSPRGQETKKARERDDGSKRQGAHEPRPKQGRSPPVPPQRRPRKAGRQRGRVAWEMMRCFIGASAHRCSCAMAHGSS